MSLGSLPVSHHPTSESPCQLAWSKGPPPATKRSQLPKGTNLTTPSSSSGWSRASVGGYPPKKNDSISCFSKCPQMTYVYIHVLKAVNMGRKTAFLEQKMRLCVILRAVTHDNFCHLIWRTYCLLSHRSNYHIQLELLSQKVWLSCKDPPYFLLTNTHLLLKPNLHAQSFLVPRWGC